jgi:hypothetical protein
MSRFYLEQLRAGARRERAWWRDVATAIEIIAATDITKPVEERAEFAMRMLRSRATRRQLSKTERIDLQALESSLHLCPISMSRSDIPSLSPLHNGPQAFMDLN